MNPLCSEFCILWKYPRSVGIISISWKYPYSVDIIRVHTATVGRVTSIRYSTLSTAPYYPLQYHTTHCINLVPPNSIHFSGCPSLSRILVLAYGSTDSHDSYPYACILPTSRDFSMTYLCLTRIQGLIDVSLILPDSREIFNT